MALDLVIDRRSPVPLYYQLSQQLEQAIHKTSAGGSTSTMSQ